MTIQLLKITIFGAVVVGIAGSLNKLMQYDNERRAARKQGEVAISQAIRLERLQGDLFHSIRMSILIMVLGMVSLVQLTPTLRDWLPALPEWMRTRDFVLAGGAAALLFVIAWLVWRVVLQLKINSCLAELEAEGGVYYTNPDDFNEGEEEVHIFQIDADDPFRDKLAFERGPDQHGDVLDYAESLSETEITRLAIYGLRQQASRVNTFMQPLVVLVLLAVAYSQLSQIFY